MQRGSPQVVAIGDDIIIPNHSGIASHPEFINHSHKLNDIENPDGNKEFSMSNKLLKFTYQAPTPAGDFGGAFEIEAKGGFTGDLVHIHQHTGNVGVVELLKIEAEDADVIPFAVISAGGVCSITGGNVGIGTAAPTNTFQVLKGGTVAGAIGGAGVFQDSTTAATDANIIIISGNTGAAQILLGDDDSHFQGRIRYNNDTNKMEFYTANNSRINISSTGVVQIEDGVLDMNTHKINNVVDPTSDQDAATKIYVDEALGADVTVLKATFDITSNTSVISAIAAKKNKIVAISFFNNDTDATDDTVVKITDGNAGTVLYGGATGAVYVVGRGGNFTLPMSAAHPYFETTVNTALYINPVSSKRVSGAVWYIQEA